MKIIVTVIITFLLMGSLQAEIRSTRTLNRELEPFIITCTQFAETNTAVNADFRNVHFRELRAFAYHKDTGSWTEIPIQFDDRNASAEYFYNINNCDSLLSIDDEAVVMCSDLGDKVSENEWIDDPQSKTYARYEVRAIDPLTNEEGWLYLFRTRTYKKTNLHDYVSVERANHRVFTDIYTIGHTVLGVWDHLSYPDVRGTFDLSNDIIDRQKVRVKGSVYGFGYNETEDALNLENSYYIDGPVRVIQKLNWKITKSLGWLGKYEFEIITQKFFYKNSFYTKGKKTLDSSVGCDLFRYSVDINENMYETGRSKFYNAHNSAIVLNSWPVQPVNRTLDLPGTFWALVTSRVGSFLQTSDISEKIGSVHQLYFCENHYGGTSDGTSDTGDKESWGDIGIMHQGSVSDTINLGTDVYLFREQIDSTTGAQIAQNNSNPVLWWGGIRAQNYDGDRPTALRLIFTERGDNSVTFSWTAPADEYESDQPVESYEIHYSTTSAQFPNDDWWNNQSTPLPNPPKPTAPGTLQSMTVKNLDHGTVYYFAARSKDDAGNWSNYSNILTVVTTPVELAGFSPSVLPNGNVELNWKTVSESNNFGFDIERKSASGDFERIGFVKGIGTTNRPQSYSFMDKNTGVGSFNYRLKQIDQDGQFVYSQSVEVELNGPSDFALEQNYPNPFNSETTISFSLKSFNSDGNSSSDEFNVEVNIYNVLGQKVQTVFSEQRPTGRYSVIWNGRDDFGQSVAGGLYFYQIIVKSANTGELAWTKMKKMILMP